jgi:FdhD protein
MNPFDTRTIERPDGLTEDVLVCEEPLEIRIEGTPLAVTMRTPGHDLELAAGFLLTEGVIDGSDDLDALAHVGTSGNVVDCVLAGGVASHRDAIERATREIYATSSCGICGKTSIDRVHLFAQPIEGRREIEIHILSQLPEELRAAQPTFDETGGLHAAGLFSVDGQMDVVREDIGRHNAVDKVIGARLRQDRLPVDDRVLVISSRASFEIVQKALMARIGTVIAVGAASTLAVDLARDSGMALYGFVRKGGWNRYS